MSIVSIKELLEAGVHYGTAASMWHPRMKPFIFGKRNGIHIIDVRQTVRGLIEAYYYAVKLGKANKTLLFVGTKRQAKDVVREAARSAGMPFVTERWLGGTLTNFDTIRQSIRRLDAIEQEMSQPEYHRITKKVQSRHMREKRRILRNLEGVRTMARLPDAMFVIDPKKEMSAVREAHRLGIPIVGLIDTDSDPDLVNLPIPGNDDGIRSIQAVVKVVLNGLARGRTEQVTRDPVAPVNDAPPPAEAKA
ncbi:MAG TPA: 30S ribosomal protein S2 [Planctomycetota bacterium]|nr:30S ribosomal protein S2 [Planctomycetota bacterium]